MKTASARGLSRRKRRLGVDFAIWRHESSWLWLVFDQHRRSPRRNHRADLSRARAAGLSVGEIVETVANVALNIFENYMSHVARVPIDFPKRESIETSGQGGESNGER